MDEIIVADTDLYYIAVRDGNIWIECKDGLDGIVVDPDELILQLMQAKNSAINGLEPALSKSL